MKNNNNPSEVATPANTREEAKKKLSSLKKDDLIEHLLDVNENYIAKEQEVEEVKASIPEEGSPEQAAIIKSLRMKVEGLNEQVTSLMQHKKRKAKTWMPTNLKENEISAIFQRNPDRENKHDAPKVKILAKGTGVNGTPPQYTWETKKCWDTTKDRMKHIRFVRYANVRAKTPDGGWIDTIAKIDEVIEIQLYIGQVHDDDTGQPTGEMWVKGSVYQKDEAAKEIFVSPAPNTAPELNHTVDEEENQKNAQIEF